MSFSLCRTACVILVLLFGSMKAAVAGGNDAAVSYGSMGWDGLYFGGSVSYAWGDADWRYANGARPAPNPQDIDGSLPGLFAGYQRSFSGLVIGIEGGFQTGLEVDGGAVCPDPLFRCNLSIEHLFTLGGRLGYRGEGFMGYVSGGFANAKVVTETPLIATNVNFDKTSQHSSGYYIGVGADIFIGKQLSIGVEYRHYDFGTKQHSAPLDQTRTIGTQFDSVTARLTMFLN